MRVVLRVRPAPRWLVRVQTNGVAVEITPEERFRRLVNAALATPYYSRRERAAELLAAGNLAAIERTPLRDLLQAPEQFENPKAKKSRPGFKAPVETTDFTVAGVKLQLPRGGREVTDLNFTSPHLSETRMLAMTPALLRRLCAAIEAGAIALPNLSEAVVALESVRDGRLLHGERDMLWRCLGVPVFEQWLGLEGELLAWECEGHEGMHLDPRQVELEEIEGEWVVTSWRALQMPSLRLATGWRGEVRRGACACGSQLPLLVGQHAVSQISTEKLALAAGVA